MTPRRTLCLLTATVVLSMPFPLRAGHPAPEFTEGACAFPVPAGVRCGFVNVPQIYGDETAGEFNLAVAIVRSRSQPARSDAMLFLAGGPGATMMAIGIRIGTQPGAGITAERDLVIIDPRGAGLSEPATCERYPEYAAQLFPADLSTEQLLARIRDLDLACLEEARDAGIAPESFGTQPMVEDIERVRRALGVGQWNAAGFSYGTVTGMALAASYPETLRSLVLNSVVLLGDSAHYYIDDTFQRALQSLAAECDRSPGCAASYSDVEARFERALARLDRAPLRVPMPPSAGVTNDVYVMNRGDFEFSIFTQMYGPEPTTLAMIKAVEEGDVETLATLLGRRNASAQLATPMARFTGIAVACRDDPRGESKSTTRPAPGQPSRGFHQLITTEICDAWAPPGPTPAVPQDVQVPTLILAGSLDPITPPDQGRIAQGIMGDQARFVEIPSIGHIPVLSPCAGSIVGRFVNDPGSELDLTCIANIEPFAFE